MSLEQSIADLTQQAGGLLDLPQAIANAATSQINAIGNAYQARLATLTTTAYIDQALGSDTAAGTLAAPYKSIEKALAMTPRGGRCIAVLKGDYVISAASIAVNGIDLLIQSDSSVKRNLYFERYLITSTTPNYRAIYGFKLGGGAKLTLSGLTVNFPAVDGSWGTYSAANSHMIGAKDSTDWLPLTVSLISCNLNIPATPFCSILEGSNLIDMLGYGNTLTGAVTSLLGRLFADQTNTAGVAANTLPWLRTNFTNV